MKIVNTTLTRTTISLKFSVKMQCIGLFLYKKKLRYQAEVFIGRRDYKRIVSNNLWLIQSILQKVIFEYRFMSL